MFIVALKVVILKKKLRIKKFKYDKNWTVGMYTMRKLGYNKSWGVVH